MPPGSDCCEARPLGARARAELVAGEPQRAGSVVASRGPFQGRGRTRLSAVDLLCETIGLSLASPLPKGTQQFVALARAAIRSAYGCGPIISTERDF
jgi:hypothetical protein